eukprot:scaffold45607_cov237-Amphora_coffeaeformis.AAC.7
MSAAGNHPDEPPLVRDAPSAKILMFVWLAAAVTVAGVYLGIFTPKANKQKHQNVYTATRNNNVTTAVVIIAWKAPSSDWEVWIAQRLKEYEKECHRLLEDYSRLIETVETKSSLAERLLHQRWQKDVQRIADTAQEQQKTLTHLMQRPLSYQLALPYPTNYQSNPTRQYCINKTKNSPQELEQPHPIRLPPTVVPEASYEGMNQMLAHLVRDWSEQGQTIRTSLYDWCLDRVPQKAYRVLVPGAGLGRLAWDLQQQSFERVVHAVELSWTMVAMFTAMVGQAPYTSTIYPYLNDFWTNQVTCDTRFQALQIPNVRVSAPRLSWTIADFIELARLPAEASQYDAVVTCFFLDTATNALDYIDAMERVLVRGGRWVNVGPLHWHANARIVLTAEDLYALFSTLKCWKIIEWSLDTEPLEYRSITTNTEGDTTSTRYEAYRPLRFVVEKK